MTKQDVLQHIKRIARENGGTPPGNERFERLTGVKKSDWYPHMWLRWGDALSEAGFPPNQFQRRVPDEFLVEKYIGLIRELGRLPVEGELRRKTRQDKSFPSHSTLRRLGGKNPLLAQVAEHCRKHAGYEDVLALCEANDAKGAAKLAVIYEKKPTIVTEFVYLVKSGPHYKIGRTNSLGRRSSELAIKIPIPPKAIHSIETDDAIGVEAYWHRRFADKRGEGEWFLLTPDDVKAFKRWKRIV